MNEINDITNHLDADTAKWFAVRTKFKGEKFVERLLVQNGITTYLPLLTKTRKYIRKIRKVQLPLIQSHVFVYIKKNQYVPVLETLHVFGFVKQGPHLVSIPTQEIELVKRIVGSNEKIGLISEEMTLGSKVEVIGGSLTGLEGHLVRKENKSTFVVSLETMGVQIEIAIDHKFLSPKKGIRMA